MIARYDYARSAFALFAGIIVVAALYFARDIFIPLSLGLLLSFILSPPARALESRRVPRAAAVPMVVVGALLAIAGLAYFIAIQVGSLAADMPRYQTELVGKIRAVKELARPGAWARAAEVVEALRKELAAEPASGAAARQPAPVAVEVKDEGVTFAGFVSSVVSLLHPVGSAFLVIVFVFFILAQREDIRERLVALAGTGDISRTTRALDETGEKLSRLFLIQSALNACFGIVIWLGLWLIGVPSAPLWGFLGAVLRFVPYIGGFLTAVFPIALAASVGDGWAMVVWTVALFVVFEALFAYLLEPMVFGHNTGISPLAVVLSAVFWTFLWGPIGLILATPLTVCLVTASRHFEALQVFNTMLREQTPLTLEQAAYHRLLAEDAAELAQQAQEFLETRPYAAYVRDIVLPILAMERADLLAGKIGSSDLPVLRDVFAEALDSISATGAAQTTGEDPGTAATGLAAVSAPLPDDDLAALKLQLTEKAPISVLCVGARDAIDDCLALACALDLAAPGVTIETQESSVVSMRKLFGFDFSRFDVVVVCFGGRVARSQVSYMRDRVARVRWRRFLRQGVKVGPTNRRTDQDEDAEAFYG